MCGFRSLLSKIVNAFSSSERPIQLRKSRYQLPRQKIPYLELDPRVEKDVFSTIAGFTILFDEKPLKVHQNWARFRSSYGVSVLTNLPETMKYTTPNCLYCGKQGDENLRCSICGNYYCEDHIWPESHGCQRITERIWTNHR